MTRPISGLILVTATAVLAVTWLAPSAIGQERECKEERIQAAGAASVFGKGRAMTLAITNWQREVRNKYGERFMQWNRARERGDECESASVGRLGRLNRRCTVAAVPCASGTLDTDRDRGRDGDRYEDRDRQDAYQPRWRRRDRDRYDNDDEDDDTYSGARRVQRLLNRWGYRIKVDGIWGGESRTALMRFQNRSGLEVDGEPGRRTMSVLVRGHNHGWRRHDRIDK